MEDFRQLKEQEKFPRHPGRMKERKIKEEKRNKKRDQKPWLEVEGEERFLYSENHSFTVGKSAGTEMNL